MISCELCSLSLRARHLNHHNLNECMFREIKCKYPDCSMIFQAREESSHYKYACKSKEIKFKYELISRARKNRGYARPWGIELEHEMLSDFDQSLT